MTRWDATAAGRRPHDLRHTTASLLDRGRDRHQNRLGLARAKLTLDTYGHMMGTDADRAALDRVNRTYGSASGPSRRDNSAGSDAETRRAGR